MSVIDSRSTSAPPKYGWHDAVCTATKRATNTFGNEQETLMFALDEYLASGTNKQVVASFGPTLRPRANGTPSKLRAALTAMLGRDPGLVYDTDQLVGHGFRVEIGPYRRQDGSESYRISDFAPLPPGAKKPVVVVGKKSTGLTLPTKPTPLTTDDVFAGLEQ